MKICFFQVKPWEEKYLKDKLKKHTITFVEKALNSSNVSKAKNCDVISIFIHSAVTKRLLDNMPHLKMITTRSTGFDHIDIEECKKRNILVCNVPFYGENTVAEHAFALIMSLSRNIHKSYVRTLKNDFSIEGLTGFDLQNKTLGIVGGGHIGMHIARMAKGFDMKVLVFDIHKDPKIAKKYGFTYASFDSLLQKSDIITLHVPHNKYTHHLINSKNIKRMKKGSILINTARGGVVDTDALFKALKSGQLGGAGLDVIEGEELIQEEKELLHTPKNARKLRLLVKDHKIFKMDNVVFTPHNAFNSQEALERILESTIENIKCYSSKKCQNLVH